MKMRRKSHVGRSPSNPLARTSFRMPAWLRKCAWGNSSEPIFTSCGGKAEKIRCIPSTPRQAVCIIDQQVEVSEEIVA